MHCRTVPDMFWRLKPNEEKKNALCLKIQRDRVPRAGTSRRRAAGGHMPEACRGLRTERRRGAQPQKHAPKLVRGSGARLKSEERAERDLDDWTTTPLRVDDSVFRSHVASLTLLRDHQNPGQDGVTRSVVRFFHFICVLLFCTPRFQHLVILILQLYLFTSIF
jgi:hypothetical protein